MRREGNRNFGVWQPPSGMDAVRRSTQINLESIDSLNNPRRGRELGITQSLIDPNWASIERSNQVGLIGEVNNIGRRFDEMIRRGWGGNVPSTSVISSPSPSPSPSGSTSFPSLPLGNLNAARIDRAMQWKTCGDFCVILYNLWEGQVLTQNICWSSSVGWVSDTWNDGVRHDTLDSWYESFYWNSTGMYEDYFIVNADIRSLCFPQISSVPPSALPPGGFDASDVDSAMALW
jgi:hypothetical protein